MKKLFVVSALIFCIFLTACGEPPTLMPFIGELTSGDQGFDFEGYKFYFYHENNPAANPDLLIFTYDKQTPQGEALLNRVNQIETEYNAEVIFNQDLDDSQFQMQSMSGVIHADVCNFTYLNAMQLFAKSGMLHPITDFPDQIDLSQEDKYGAANMLEPGMYKGVPYVVCPLYWPGFQALDSFALVYNTELLEPAGITNFHEFYENKTWTWDTFEDEYLKKFRMPTIDGYVDLFAAGNMQYFDMLMYSNGTQFITRGENGNNIVNTFPLAFQHAYEKGAEWYAEYGDLFDLKDAAFYFGNFIQGDVGVTVSTAEHLTVGGIAYLANFRYNIMPFPCGPDATYGEWAQFIQRAQGFGIAKSSKDPQIAAQILSLLLDPFEELGGDAGLYEYYADMTFTEELDAQIFFDLMNYTRYDYTFWDMSDVGRKVASNFGVALEQGKSAAEAYDLFKNYLDYMVIECMLPNFDYMYDNYYSLKENN